MTAAATLGAAEAGGYAIVPGIPGAGVATCEALLREALALADGAVRQELLTTDDAPRGGNPARRLFTHPGGPRQLAVYTDHAVLQALSSLAGRGLTPTGGHGSYSYYLRPGDHLALHRDIPRCDLALITCLCDTGGDGTSGSLVVYSARVGESLAAIRATPVDGAVPVALPPGRSLVLLGGTVPHAILPVAAGQFRVVSLLCYRVT